MKLTYNPRYNIAYLRLLAKTAKVETIQVSDEVNVDLAPDETVYGIELLNANVQLVQKDAGQLVFHNEATGEQTQVKLPSLKQLCSFQHHSLVVKCPSDDAFVVTAYLTDQLKTGESIWPKK